MEIPYGRSSFEEIRRRDCFYVDKTPFLPLLERMSVGYPLLLRPRRFGKSTLLSMLDYYYDIGHKDRYDELFRGLWVHDHPTPERSSYLVLLLDFSRVATDGGPERVRSTFFEAVHSRVKAFLQRYRGLHAPLGEIHDKIDRFQDPGSLIGEVMDMISISRYRVYLLVDEYDHFANRLLARGDQESYESVIQDAGFVRTFYATLKASTGRAIERMFITGVTPLMLDDLSSGFNIASNISMDPDMNTLAGFTRADVERGVDDLLAAVPHLAGSPELSDRSALIEVLERHYDGYRFCEDASERVFNSDMVLYFLSEVAKRRRYPAEMLDHNVRTEYRHLQQIGVASGTAAAERRELLTRILTEGHIRSGIVRQFGVSSLASHAPYISLLYYLGMLTLRDVPRDLVGYDLEIPNLVIRDLQWEHLAMMLRQQASITVQVEDLNAALEAMAVQGDIAPFLHLFHSQVLGALGIKDTRGLSEKTIKLLLMTYASLGRAFHPLSEKEFAQGYCDLFLGASPVVAGAHFSWLLEFKYEKAGAKAAQIEAAFAEAEAQVERYAADKDLLPLLVGNRRLRAGMLVFLGTKKVLFRPWPPEPGAPLEVPARSASARPARRPKSAPRARTPGPPKPRKAAKARKPARDARKPVPPSRSRSR